MPTIPFQVVYHFLKIVNTYSFFFVLQISRQPTLAPLLTTNIPSPFLLILSKVIARYAYSLVWLPHIPQRSLHMSHGWVLITASKKSVSYVNNQSRQILTYLSQNLWRFQNPNRVSSRCIYLVPRRVILVIPLLLFCNLFNTWTSLQEAATTGSSKFYAWQEHGFKCKCYDPYCSWEAYLFQWFPRWQCRHLTWEVETWYTRLHARFGGACVLWWGARPTSSPTPHRQPIGTEARSPFIVADRSTATTTA